MRISKALIIGIVVALAAGGVEAVAQEAITSAADPAEENEAITVPNGRIGDRVAYLHVEHLGPADPIDYLDGYTLEWGGDGFQVDSVGQQADKTGLFHDVVLISQHSGGAGSGGLAGMEWSSSLNATLTRAIDLGTRDHIGNRVDSDMDRTRLFAQQYRDDWAYFFYGPYGGHEGGHIEGVDLEVRSKAMPLFHQGRPYRVGDSLPDYAQALLASDDGLDDVWGAIDVTDLDVQSSVVQRGVVGEFPALDLRTEGCFRVEATVIGGWLFEPGATRIFGLPMPVPSNVCFTIDQWLSHDVPYPLLTDVQATINGTNMIGLTTSLAGYEPGTVPIPWKEPARLAYRNAFPDLERSPMDQHYPADGGGLRFSYSPSAAIRAVETDPTLIGFTTWRLEHESAFLAGLDMRPTGPDGQGRVWSILYAQPDGIAFVVQTEKAASAALPAQTEVGELTVARSGAGQFPGGQVTFAAAQRLRQEFVSSPEGKLEPNTASWGLAIVPAGLWCERAASCAPALDGTWPVYSPDELALGHTATYSTTGRFTTQAGAAPAPQGTIVINAGDGTLSRTAELYREFSIQPLAIAPGYVAPTPMATGIPPATQVDLAPAAVVSLSVLALFLVAYFLPLLKFIGTQATFFIPGYAKTDRSELLNNKIRDVITTAIRADPGVTAPQLQALTGAGWSTVVYHLGLLERKKIVSSLLDGRHKRFFPVESVNWSDRTRFVALKNARTRELYDAILGEPGVGFRELSHRVGISRPALYWHVDRLTNAGLVGEDREGAKRRFYANQVPPLYDPNEAREVA